MAHIICGIHTASAPMPSQNAPWMVDGSHQDQSDEKLLNCYTSFGTKPGPGADAKDFRRHQSPAGPIARQAAKPTTMRPATAADRLCHKRHRDASVGRRHWDA